MVTRIHNTSISAVLGYVGMKKHKQPALLCLFIIAMYTMISKADVWSVMPHHHIHGVLIRRELWVFLKTKFYLDKLGFVYSVISSDFVMN